MTTRILLMGCTSSKMTALAPARELYQGDLWSKRRAYAESQGCPWYILSALHGVVDPDRVLEPYDCTLTQARQQVRPWQTDGLVHHLWSTLVFKLPRYNPARMRWTPDDPKACVLEVYAGAPYVELVRSAVDAHRVSERVQVVAPLAGLQIGERKRWYKQQLSDPAQVDMWGGP